MALNTDWGLGRERVRPSWRWQSGRGQEAAGAWWREKMSSFGKPWPEVSTLAEKTLGSKAHRFASESPGNDQFLRGLAQLVDVVVFVNTFEPLRPSCDMFTVHHKVSSRHQEPAPLCKLII